MVDKIEKTDEVSVPMERSKFAEIRSKVAYIQELLDDLEVKIKEAELADDINRKVEVSESVLLVGTTVTDVDEYDKYAVDNCKEISACQAWTPVLCVVGIAALVISLVFLAT